MSALRGWPRTRWQIPHLDALLVTDPVGKHTVTHKDRLYHLHPLGVTLPAEGSDAEATAQVCALVLRMRRADATCCADLLALLGTHVAQGVARAQAVAGDVRPGYAPVAVQCCAH